MAVPARAAGGQGDARIVLMAGVVVGAFANAAIMVALAWLIPDRRMERVMTQI